MNTARPKNLPSIMKRREENRMKKAHFDLKKTLALLLAVVMCLSVLPVVAPSAKAEGEVTVLDLSMITYKINEDGTLTITDYMADPENRPGIEIPVSFEIDGETYVVSVIGDDAFAAKGISTLVFAEGSQIVEIGQRAFATNTFHTTNFPETLKLVRHHAFSGIEWWGTLDLSHTQIVTIEPWAFTKVVEHAQIKFPKTLEVIREGNFYNNKLGSDNRAEDTYVEFPASLRYIGYQCFKKESGHSNPRTVLDFSRFAPGEIAYDISAYESGTADDESYEDYMDMDKNDSATRWGFSCDNARVIWGDPGERNKKATDSPFIFDYENGVIVGLKDECATEDFGDLWKLTTEKAGSYIYSDPENPTKGKTVTCYKGDLRIPKEIGGVKVTGIYPGAFNRYPAYLQLRSVTFEDGVEITDIKPYTFKCQNLEAVNNLPASVTTIRMRAFAVCKSLKEITLPGVTVVERLAFQNCESLEKVTFESDKILSIHPLAFSPIASTKLTEIHIEEMEQGVKTGEDDVTHVGNFSSDMYKAGSETPYAKIYWKDGVQETEVYVGTDRNGLKWYFDGRAKKILSYAGTDYTAIDGTAVAIPSTLRNDSDGTNVEIKTLGNNGRIFNLTDADGNLLAFPHITTLTIDPGIKVISDKVFAQDGADTPVRIDTVDLSGSTVERIGQDAFYCTYTSTLKLPDTLRSTKINCFAGAGQAFTEVEIPGNITYLHGGSFTGVKTLERITVYMNRYGLTDDEGFVQGEWKYGDTVYKKAPESVFTGAPFGADQSEGLIQVKYMDSPKAAPKYVLTPNTDNNTVEITVDAYSTYNFYVVSDVRYAGTVDGSSDTAIGSVTKEAAAVMGMENPTTTNPVAAKANGTYNFDYTTSLVVSEGTIVPDAYKFESSDSVEVDLFHTVTYAKSEGFASQGAVPTDSDLYVPGYLVTAKAPGDDVKLDNHAFLGWTYTVKTVETVVEETEEGPVERTEERDVDVFVAAGEKFEMPDEDVVLYETWRNTDNDKVKVVFHAGEGKFGNVSELTLYCGLDATISSVLGNYKALRIGYSLLGWTELDSDESVTVIPETSKLTALDTVGEYEYHLYAKWEILHDITVDFKANGGRFETDEIVFTGDYGKQFTVPAVSKPGYKLTGWNTKANGSGDKLATEETDGGLCFRIPASRTTYYAQWEPAFHDIEFIILSENAKITSEDTVIEHVATESVIGLASGWNGFVLPNVLPDEGYKFIGWKAATKNEGSDEYTYVNDTLYTELDDIRDIVIGTEDMYFIAQIIEIPMGTIIFDYNGGKDSNGKYNSSATGEVDTIILAKDVPSGMEKTDCKFVGWTVNGEAVDEWNLKFENNPITVKAEWVSTNPTPDPKPLPTPDPEPDYDLKDKSYMNGDAGKDTFRPDAGLKRSEVAQIFFNLMSKDEKEVKYNKTFTDVKESNWYYEAVTALSGRGIIKGYPDGSFKPDKYITRAEFVTICARFEELTGTTTAYKDVVGHWAEKYIISAEAKGWLHAFTEEQFNPNTAIKRKETTSIVNSYLKRVPDKEFIDANASKINKFSDVDAKDPFFYDIIEASYTHEYYKDEQGLEHWKPID